MFEYLTLPYLILGEMCKLYHRTSRQVRCDTHTVRGGQGHVAVHKSYNLTALDQVTTLAGAGAPRPLSAPPYTIPPRGSWPRRLSGRVYLCACECVPWPCVGRSVTHSVRTQVKRNSRKGVVCGAVW